VGKCVLRRVRRGSGYEREQTMVLVKEGRKEGKEEGESVKSGSKGPKSKTNKHK
jgi:hypothetical protein